jgi:hypothetical protein
METNEAKDKFYYSLGCGAADGIMELYPMIFALKPLGYAFMKGHVRKCERCREKYAADMEAYKAEEARQNATKNDLG